MYGKKKNYIKKMELGGAAASAASGTPWGLIAQGAGMVGDAIGNSILSGNVDEDGLLKNTDATSAGLITKTITNPVKLIGGIVDGISNIGKEPVDRVLGRMVGLGAKYDAEKQRKELQKQRLNQTINEGQQRYLASNRFGNNVIQMYAMGGKTDPLYNAEDEEIIIGKPKAVSGGKLKKLKTNLYEVDGKKHKDGGVNIVGGEFVISDSEKLALGGKTPAEKVKDGESIDKVIQMQELLKNNLNIENMYKNKIKKMDLGGPTEANLLPLDMLTNLLGSIVPDKLRTSYIKPITPKGFENKMPIINAPNIGKINKVNQQNSTGSLLKKLLPVGNELLNNADILTNAAINANIRKRPVPKIKAQTKLQPNEVRADAQINDINTSMRAAQRGLENNNSANTIANKLQALATGIDAKSRVMEGVNNFNAQSRDRVNMVNADIERQNINADLQNQMLAYQISDDIDQRNSMNVARAVERRNIKNQDKERNKLMKLQQMVQLAGSDPRSVDYLFNTLGTGDLSALLDIFMRQK